MLEEIDAHTAALWSLCVLPDKRGIVTGSADKSVKFWQFELIADDSDNEQEEEETANQSSRYDDMVPVRRPFNCDLIPRNLIPRDLIPRDLIPCDPTWPFLAL